MKTTKPVSPVSVRQLNAAIEALWPLEGQAEWDASGIICGRLDDPVTSALVAVDVTGDVVDEAIERGVDALVAHHPLLLRGVTSVADDRYKGELVTRLIREGIALIAVHTNGDRVESGTSVSLATAIGVAPTGVIEPHRLGGGIGVTGTVEPTTLGAFARRIADAIPATAAGVRVAGDYAQPIRSVALCAGAGDSLLGHAAVTEADVYITSDLRHHPASEFREQAKRGTGTALIDISHWAAEWLWLDRAATQLRESLPSVTITVSEINTDPWTFAVVQ